MAGVPVQSAHNNSLSVTSLTITPASNLGSGNLMGVSFYGRGTAHAISGGSGTWTKQITVTNFNGNAHEFWTCPVAAGDAGTKPTFTFSQTGADWMTIIWAEFSGVDTSSTPISTSATGQAFSSATPTAGPTGTSGANELGLAICQMDGGTVPTTDTGSGFTALENVATSLPADMAYKTVNSTTLTATSLKSGSDVWSEIAVVLKLSGGGGGAFDPSSVPWMSQLPESATLAVVGF